jgi:hypothetical protein
MLNGRNPLLNSEKHYLIFLKPYRYFIIVGYPVHLFDKIEVLNSRLNLVYFSPTNL